MVSSLLWLGSVYSTGTSKSSASISLKQQVTSPKYWFLPFYFIHQYLGGRFYLLFNAGLTKYFGFSKCMAICCTGRLGHLNPLFSYLKSVAFPVIRLSSALKFQKFGHYVTDFFLLGLGIDIFGFTWILDIWID